MGKEVGFFVQSFNDNKRVKSISLLVVVLLSFLLSGCAGGMGEFYAAAWLLSKLAQGKSSAEMLEIQTRTFNAEDTELVMKSILNVLQDDGFIINETRSVTLTAFKGIVTKNATVEASATVSEFDKLTQVRVIFRQKFYDSNGNGNVSRVMLIYDPKVYQEFYAKVDKELLIQKE